MEQPAVNEIYRHFKGNLYKVITLATHSETGEQMVVYQALYGDFAVYVRPLSMFVSRVDREKYPKITQEYRFERVDSMITPVMPGNNIANMQIEQTSIEQPKPADDEQESADIDPLVLEFLDADTMPQKRNILAALHHRITEDMIGTLAVSLDMVIDNGDLEERYQQLRNCINTKEKFECERP